VYIAGGEWVKTVAVLTSGGDAPGMNAALRAVVRKALYAGVDVYGIERGYDGLIEGRFMPLHPQSVGSVIQRGGTVLRTARSAAFRTTDGFNRALEQLRKRSVEALIVIGGDGSLAGAMKLSANGVNTVVIPATIDNDMSGTEYTIGFDTAVNTALDAVNKIRDTAASHEQVAVVEVMGRNSGHIALMAGLACGAEVVLLPEMPLEMAAVTERLLRSHQRGKLYSIVIVAEGVARGHEIAGQITKATGFKSHVTVLGYIQRGGSPSAYDSIIASRMGAAAVDELQAGKKDLLIALQHGQLISIPYDALSGNRQGIDLTLYELTGILAT
jgi:6-phosphofructokinase 1